MGNRQKKRKKTHVPLEEEVHDANGNYCGMIARNETGKWAIGWNMVPADPFFYVYDSAADARRACMENISSSAP